jgi:hypothetical protein
MVMSPAGLGLKNDCAGEAQQQGCYIRTITENFQLENKLLVVSLKGLVTKTN